jgi:hypothetical protein
VRRGLDLHDSVQDLSEALGRRVIVLDAEQHVIAYSIHESPTDRRRLSIVLAHSDSWPRPRYSDGLCRTEIDGLGRCLLVALEDPRQTVGAILLVLDGLRDEVTAAQRRLLRDRAAQLGPLVSLRSLYAEHDRLRARQLLESLVGPDEHRRDAAATALVAEQLVGASSRYCAVAVGAQSSNTPPGVAQDDRTALAVETTLSFVARTSTASVVGATLPDGAGILVFPRPVVLGRLTRILERPELHGIRAGIGPLVGGPGRGPYVLRTGPPRAARDPQRSGRPPRRRRMGPPGPRPVAGPAAPGRTRHRRPA